MYRAEVLADSLHPTGGRLTTYLVEYPRVVLAEAVTHRLNADSWGDGYSWCERTTTPDISKNSASSRAIPHERFLKKIDLDPYMPAFTGKAKGMQGAALGENTAEYAKAAWHNAKTVAMKWAAELDRLGVHKQDSNRLLEPFSWTTQVVTSAHWDNFFALRCHEAAHPALRRVARMMFLARRRSEPVALDYGEWHTPFVPPVRGQAVAWDPAAGSAVPPYLTHGEARGAVPVELWRSVARCAWVSYESHDRDATDAAVMATVDRLIGSRPVHASPCEHQAMCVPPGSLLKGQASNLGDGWLQLRKLLPAERCDKYEPTDAEVASWPESAEEFGWTNLD